MQTYKRMKEVMEYNREEVLMNEVIAGVTKVRAKREMSYETNDDHLIVFNMYAHYNRVKIIKMYGRRHTFIIKHTHIYIYIYIYNPTTFFCRLQLNYI